MISDSWPSVLIGVMPFAVFFLLLTILWRRLSCLECGTTAPLLVSPLAKTRRQWVEGGWICPTCGTNVDDRGRKVTPGTGPRPDWLICNALRVVPPGIVAVVLFFLAISLSRQAEPPLAPELPCADAAVTVPEPPAGQGLR